MIDRDSLIDAMEELEKEPFTLNKCEKLACIYTVFDHVYGQRNAKTQHSAETPFFAKAKGKPEYELLAIFDELMSTIEVLQPNLYTAVIDKIEKI